MNDDTRRPSDDDATADAEMGRRLREALTPEEVQPDQDRVRALISLVEQARTDRDADAGAGAGTGRHARPEARSLTRRRALALAAGVALLGGAAAVGAAVDHRLGRSGEDLLARGTPEFTATVTGTGIDVEVDGDKAPEGRILTLRSQTLPVLPTGGYYELWFRTGDADADRISAGTFHPDTDGNTVVVLHAAVDPGRATGLEITREPAPDGTPGGVVARGTLRLR